MNDLERRVDALENEQSAQDRPPFRTFTLAEWDRMTKGEQDAAADSCKVYIGLDFSAAWDQPDEVNA